MAIRPDIERELSAWLDGELDAERALEVEARVAADPALASRVRLLSATGAALRREVEEVEDRIDFSSFSSRVMQTIEAEASEAGTIPRLERSDAKVSSLWDRLRERLLSALSAYRPAFAAAATMLVVIGGGSYFWLVSQGNEGDAFGTVMVRGGSTVIEDLRFGDGSAVVYRTEADVTVIWVTED